MLRVDVDITLIISGGAVIMKIDAQILKLSRHIAGLIVTVGSLAACTAAAPPGPVVRTGAATAAISSTVTAPVGYETIYLSGMTGTLRAPDGSAPGTPAPDSGDTEAQATRALGTIKTALASKGLGFGDIVMMHAYLAPDPQTGRGDSAGWTNRLCRYMPCWYVYVYADHVEPGRPSPHRDETTR